MFDIHKLIPSAPFSLRTVVSSTKREKHIGFYKGSSLKSLNFESNYPVIILKPEIKAIYQSNLDKT